MTDTTQTPWDTKPAAGGHQHLIWDESGKTIAVVYTNAADAELICRTVNSGAAVEKVMERQPQFAIGHQYRSRGKRTLVCTITDILRTYNSRGELVRLRYVSEHTFNGQIVTDHDVLETTISRSLIEAA